MIQALEYFKIIIIETFTPTLPLKLVFRLNSEWLNSKKDLVLILWMFAVGLSGWSTSLFSKALLFDDLETINQTGNNTEKINKI